VPKLLQTIRAELAAAADPARAPKMQAYMKSAMPYHGVPSPAVKAICKRIFAPLELEDARQWERLVRELWDGARFREERYAALQLAGHRRAREFHTPDAMRLFERLIVEGAWWDYVDDIASHRVGQVLRDHPARLKPLLRRWSDCENLWKRRTSIICQLGFGKETDLELLYDCIEPSLGSDEFFLRKAIGWALRQYAWTDPREVRRYVARNEKRLSALSRREALKNIK
jgi:3-methyladenine DNA glycosylase AlkD